MQRLFIASVVVACSFCRIPHRRYLHRLQAVCNQLRIRSPRWRLVVLDALRACTKRVNAWQSRTVVGGRGEDLVDDHACEKMETRWPGVGYIQYEIVALGESGRAMEAGQGMGGGRDGATVAGADSLAEGAPHPQTGLLTRCGMPVVAALLRTELTQIHVII
jgi:hypothetical protein